VSLEIAALIVLAILAFLGVIGWAWLWIPAAVLILQGLFAVVVLSVGAFAWRR